MNSRNETVGVRTGIRIFEEILVKTKSEWLVKLSRKL
jgi:hypothetical protein